MLLHVAKTCNYSWVTTKWPPAKYPLPSGKLFKVFFTFFFRKIHWHLIFTLQGLADIGSGYWRGLSWPWQSNPFPDTAVKVLKSKLELFVRLGIRNLEPNCQYSYSSSSSYSCSEIVACQRFYLHEDFSLLGPPLNMLPLKTFTYVSLRYRKRHGVVGDKKIQKVKKWKKLKSKKVLKKSKKLKKLNKSKKKSKKSKKKK